MDILKPSALTAELLNTGQSGVPLIICTDVPRVKRRIDDAGYQEVRINQELSKRLLEHPRDERPKLVEQTLKSILNYHVPIHDNIRKSRDILMNLWVYPFEDEKANQIWQQALEAIKNGNEDKLAMHWCMLLLYYPVFVDVTGMIGKLSTMQDSFSLAWLKDKMFEEWGERTTLLHSLDKIMQTLRQIGAVESKGGVYTVKKYEITDATTKKIILKTILALKMQAYYEPSELAKVPQMFPFDYTVDSELIFGNQNFEMGNFGGNPVVVG